MLGQRFARHAHNRGCGSVNLKATNVAATALNDTERVYAGVTNFPGGAVSATPKLAIENNSTAYAGAKRQANDRTTTAPCSLPHLAEGGSISIVLEQHGSSQRSVQRRREFISR